ncbi:MAG TPA: c-type cytochrome [Gallionella sp.]|nr:c-type cytochrome [Gallionella sp.]
MIRLRKITFAGLLAAILFAGATASAAEPAEIIRQPNTGGDPVAGKTESGFCQGCHGVQGISFVDLIPNLAGQSAPYTAKQLRDFQSGARTHQTMSSLSKSINATELADISAYFAGMKMMRGDGSGNNPAAEKLFRNGDPARNIPGCASCHGTNGKQPVSATYPVIGGQHRGYLQVQLFHFRGGERSNSPDGMMSRAAKNLTDAEIGSLSDYLSGL